MTNLDTSIRLLLSKREELLGQVDAIDRAVAALRGESSVSTAPQHGSSAVAAIPSADIVVLRVKPKRVLSDEHKHKLADGRRRAREAKGVVSGDVREPVSDTFVPALAAPVDQTPRLVKRTVVRELTVVSDEEPVDALEAVLS